MLAATGVMGYPYVVAAGKIFDDKMAVVNASQRGGIRGTVLPLLLDLARKPNFLHDNSVPTMDRLLDPSRGATSPTRSACRTRRSATTW